MWFTVGFYVPGNVRDSWVAVLWSFLRCVWDHYWQHWGRIEWKVGSLGHNLWQLFYGYKRNPIFGTNTKYLFLGARERSSHDLREKSRRERESISKTRTSPMFCAKNSIQRKNTCAQRDEKNSVGIASGIFVSFSILILTNYSTLYTQRLDKSQLTHFIIFVEKGTQTVIPVHSTAQLLHHLLTTCTSV